jgi:hypothetical protein
MLFVSSEVTSQEVTEVFAGLVVVVVRTACSGILFAAVSISYEIVED